jgi:cobalamin-dependent methionine synthase I
MVTLEPKLNEGVLERARSNTLKRLGYNARQSPHPEVERTLDEALVVAEKATKPKGMYRFLPVLKTGKDGVRIETGSIQSARFAHLVDTCTGDRSILFMIATLGEEPEGPSDSQEPVLRQLMSHTLCSELAELVADMVEARWRKEADNAGLQYSLRFSPGYCDWALEGQAAIFNSLDAAEIGVQLTPHFVMIPGKTISAVAAIAKEVPIPSFCIFCGTEDCQWRVLPRKKV